MWFESCVVLDGDKTLLGRICDTTAFESCVVLDGDKTQFNDGAAHALLESCVVLDGDKTIARYGSSRPVFESCVILAGDKNRPNAAACASRFEICAVSDGGKHLARRINANACLRAAPLRRMQPLTAAPAGIAKTSPRPWRILGIFSKRCRRRRTGAGKRAGSRAGCPAC